MVTQRIEAKQNTAQFNAEVNKTIKKEFDIKLLQNQELPGHSRNEVTNHLLKYYSMNGLPELEE